MNRISAAATVFVLSLPLAAQAQEHRIKNGEKIAPVLAKAQPGDVLVVEPGVYQEALVNDKPFITLKGVVNGGKRPVLEGAGKLADGVISSGDNFRISGFTIQNYKGNGVTVQGAKNAVMTDLEVIKTGLYGLYPVNTDGVIIERCHITGIADAGIYVGQSRNIQVRWNVVKENVAGIEIENSEGAVVEYNMAANNTGGILSFVLPGLKEKTGNTVRIVKNFVVDNNHPNFADPKGIVAKVPVGTGILLVAQDTTLVADNYISGNWSFGIGVVGLDLLDDAKKDPEVEPNSDNNRIEENYYLNNGLKPQGLVKMMAARSGDVVSVGAGKGNCLNPVPGIVTLLAAKQFPPCSGDREAFMKDAADKAYVAYAERMKSRLSMANMPLSHQLGFDPNKPPKGTHVVRIQNMTYNPMVLNISKGDKVVWINMDGAAHTVTSSKGGVELDPVGVLHSPMLDKGMTYDFTFKTPGKYIYLCLPHISQAPMRDAVINVKDGPAAR